jgi:acetoin utilization deacetylase AcuC-like enzyme
LRAVDAVLDGEVDNAYALVRPCGHHALAERGMGSCIFANGPLAALHALERQDVQRVAIVDWDVHHGNGAQDAFWDTANVLAISVHQADGYPRGSGALNETGEGAGAGFNLNIPLPPGSGHGAYIAAFERVVAPALRAFDPDLILVACGFDASALDPLGRMMLHSQTFAAMTRIVKEAAAETCGGRLVVCHEGGYSAAYVPFCGIAVVETLAESPSGVEDPFLASYASRAYQELQPHQEAIVDAAARHAHLPVTTTSYSAT